MGSGGLLDRGMVTLGIREHEAVRGSHRGSSPQILTPAPVPGLATEAGADLPDGDGELGGKMVFAAPVPMVAPR